MLRAYAVPSFDSREYASQLVAQVASRDPARAWELWMTYRIKEQLDTAVSLLTILAISVVVLTLITWIWA